MKSSPYSTRREGAGDSNRVVLVIVVLALLFIVIITYFVAHMPQKPEPPKLIRHVLRS